MRAYGQVAQVHGIPPFSARVVQSRTVRLINGVALDECHRSGALPDARTNLPPIYLPVGNISRSLIVACSRSRLPEAMARTSSSHSGPSGLGSIPFRRKKTIQLPRAARLLPSMKG